MSEAAAIREQPAEHADLPFAINGLDRRRFLELAAASLALGGTVGCGVRQPREEIVPYVRAPEYAIAGKPRYYATAVTLGGYATGVLVESHMGRPTRIEGNPDHSASLGGIDAISQAAILSLYDPDRSQAITARGEIRTWDTVVGELEAAVGRLQLRQGAGIRILTETVASPTLAAQLTRLLERFPQARWHQYEPVNQDNVLTGAERALGRPVETRYRMESADVVLALDADFLSFGPGHVRYARDFLSRRRLPSAEQANDAAAMNRLYVLETTYTNTGAVADHRLPLSPSQMTAAARYLARAVGVPGDQDADGGLSEAARRWLDAAAADLRSRRGLVVTGLWQPPEIHALVHAMNASLGAVGESLEYTEPVAARPVNQVQSLRELVDAAQNGEVELLLIAGGNPVYDAPADIPFAEALGQIGLTVRLGLYEDETSRRCSVHVPAAHELESWSDARAFDGTATILQPMIEPLYSGKTIHELVAVLLGEPGRSSHEIVREFWRGQYGEEGFERFWRSALHDGVVPDSRFEAIALTPAGTGTVAAAPADERPGATANADRIAVAFRPDPTLFDGRFANNAWLQELPKPITKLTWDNAALMSPQTAQRLGVQNEQLLELQSEGRALRLPAWTVPGHADACLTVYLGHGRTAVGRVGRNHGFDTFGLRRADAMWTAANVAVRALDGTYPLACTQHHHRMEGRDLVRTATWEEYREHPDFAAGHDHGEAVSLYPPNTGQLGEGRYAWGMSINLNACTGCNACVLACQAENNIPTVGKEQVRRGREMHWIRIDQYFVGEGDNPQAVHQPVTCMHCENAPCELVCPVAATVHSAEGLNEMVYNRCVGTRYCSNNCPYKVRRFNFLNYTDKETPVFKLLHNPDVTVRSRGVMEKCTYCVQRISAARIDAKKQNRPIRDGEVVTACQSVCPTQAIVFGDTADPTTRVSQLKALPLDYGLLTELNTKPRTTYLARVTNPNPELA